MEFEQILPVQVLICRHQVRLAICCVVLAVLCVAAAIRPAGAAEWLRAAPNTDSPAWGIRGGLQFGLRSDRPGPRDGPRGLIRIRCGVLADGRYDLVNFIAVEPVVKGRRGYSELEFSRLDRAAGKRIWPAAEVDKTSGRLEPGKLTELSPGVQQLEVTLRVERFDNGAHVYLVAAQRSDAPDEVRFTVHAEADSAPLDYCVLTATMGNKARARLLWLKDEVLSSRTLYADYRGNDFAPTMLLRQQRLHRTAGGDVLVAITTDEEDPAAVYPFPGTYLWYYGGAKVTQYWRKPAATVHDELCAAVNGRYTYWRTRWPIPGGVALENFELREKFYDGQSFIFGVTRQTPQALGFTAAAPTPHFSQ